MRQFLILHPPTTLLKSNSLTPHRRGTSRPLGINGRTPRGALAKVRGQRHAGLTSRRRTVLIGPRARRHPYRARAGGHTEVRHHHIRALGELGHAVVLIPRTAASHVRDRRGLALPRECALEEGGGGVGDAPIAAFRCDPVGVDGVTGGGCEAAGRVVDGGEGGRAADDGGVGGVAVRDWVAVGAFFGVENGGAAGAGKARGGGDERSEGGGGG